MTHLPVIDASLADRLCRGLLPLVEGADALAARLLVMGFAAHLPWQKFFESFAGNEQELLEYRSHRIEQAKEALGRPWPRSMFERSASYFSSDLIRSSIERRDRDNGVEEEQLANLYPRLEVLWRRELTKCDRHRVQLQMEHREEYERLRSEAGEASRAVLVGEVETWATGVCGAQASSFRDPTEAYAAAMESHASRLGFSRDPAKSRGSRVPIFSKPVVAEWDLCWAIEQPQVFIGSAQTNLFSPDLQLRSRRLTGSSDRVPYDRYLTLRYQTMVPEFSRAYHAFSDFASLETFVRAHLALYELVAPLMEDVIKRCMLH